MTIRHAPSVFDGPFSTPEFYRSHSRLRSRHDDYAPSVRVEMPGDGGFIEFLKADRGLYLVSHDFVLDEARPILVEGADVLALHVQIQGQQSTRLPGRSVRHQNMMTSVVVQSRGERAVIDTPAGATARGVLLVLELASVAKVFGDRTTMARAHINRLLKSTGQEAPCHRALPGEAFMTAAQITRCTLSGETRSRYLMAKANEMLCYFLETLIRPSDARGVNVALSSADLRRVEAAHGLLIGGLDAPLELDTLARSVGINRNKLVAGFRTLYGRAPIEHLREVRMTKAYELVEQTDASITNIAFELGFDHSNNFSTAFRRRFGVTPRMVRHRTTTL